MFVLLSLKDLGPGRYNGPKYGAEALAQSYLDDRESIKILDIAAGTGFLGEEVRINTIL